MPNSSVGCRDNDGMNVVRRWGSSGGHDRSARIADEVLGGQKESEFGEDTERVEVRRRGKRKGRKEEENRRRKFNFVNPKLN